MPFVFANPERHPFSVTAGDDYRCGVCRKPRALHMGEPEATKVSNIDPNTTRIRSPGMGSAMRRGLLTDRKIDKYRKMGYYTAEFYERRRAAMARKQSRGNFREVEGRLIYSP